VRSIIAFGRDWYGDASGPLRRADPLLMGAAFAYNSLFAIVPLALAFVSILTLFDTTHEVLTNTYRLFEESLPPDIASFLIQILGESVAVVEDHRAVILVVTLLVALWSGSRAVYTMQKALRLVDDSGAEIGYVQMRATGILVTIGAGIGVFAAYAMLTLALDVSGRLAPDIPDHLPIWEFAVAAAASLWVFLLLYAVYRWGAPRPLRRPATISALVTAILVVGTWVVVNLVPSGSSASIAVFGSLGLILIWLYGVGVAVVAGPIAVESLLRVLEKE
jgi:membrane protein